MKLFKKHIFNLLGWISFGLGSLGVFLPILPTTPLILLAAYFFSKGSPKFYNWLINLKYFGKKIKDWNEYGVIDRKSKILASVLLILILGAFIFYTERPTWVKALLGVIFTGVMIFINTRPSVKVKKAKIKTLKK